MIQRIQSLYLLLAAIASGVLIFFLPLYTISGIVHYILGDPTFMILTVLSTIVSLFSIFRYRNRQQQVVSGRINIILNFVLFGFILYLFFSDPSAEATGLGLASFMPIVAVVFISLANRSIMKDEALVRSADRLRVGNLPAIRGWLRAPLMD
ncbi:MAG: DUF4293 domain-containing protein [Owenweeksia sp.]|nr:DUF4293 domain-containing protein [Owenweeksia sp.]